MYTNSLQMKLQYSNLEIYFIDKELIIGRVCKIFG